MVAGMALFERRAGMSRGVQHSCSFVHRARVSGDFAAGCCAGHVNGYCSLVALTIRRLV